MRGMIARHEDGDVSLLQSFVHHQVVVANTDETKSLQILVVNMGDFTVLAFTCREAF